MFEPTYTLSGNLTPKTVMLDFEIGAMNAFKKHLVK